MRVLILGGAGRIGAPVARLLAADAAVTEVGVAGRDVARAEAVTAAVGTKARALRVDATDQAALARAAGAFDLVLNAAGPDFEVGVPALRACVAARTHYVDINADGRATEEMLALDEEARAAGVTALVGIGHVPGISSLMMMYAARKLDRVDAVELGATWVVTRALLEAVGDAAAMRASGRVSATWQQIMRWATAPVRALRGGQLVELSPAEQGRRVALPDGVLFEVFPIASTEAITLPRTLAGVREVTTLLGLRPPRLNQLLHRVTAGAADATAATKAFLETIEADVDHWLAGANASHHRLWATATGQREGKPARFTCWPRTPWPSTVGPLGTAALMILRGEIARRGVLTPEACLEPLPFLEAAARRGPQPIEGALFHEAWTAPLK